MAPVASGGGFAAGSSQPLVGHASSSTGNLSPSSMAVGSSASHQPSGSHVTYDAHIPIVPYSGLGYSSSPAAGSSPMSGVSSRLAYLAGNAGTNFNLSLPSVNFPFLKFSFTDF